MRNRSLASMATLATLPTLARTRRLATSAAAALSLASVAGCFSAGATDHTSSNESASSGGPQGGLACGADAGTTPAPTDFLSWTRLLRRTTMTLTGAPPTDDAYEAMAAAGTDAAREAILDATVDAALAAPTFYEELLELGHDWLKTSQYVTGAQGDAYQGSMAGHLWQCASGTKHAGALYYWADLGENGAVDNLCKDLDLTGAAITPEVRSVEPWWAPGTTVTVLGKAGLGTTEITDAEGKTIDCGRSQVGYYDATIPHGCSCGPNLVYCSPFKDPSSQREASQKRQAWEEPARLFAHIGWYDRPLSDLIVGNYSVGTPAVRSLYVRLGRRDGAHPEIDADPSWWQPSADPRDPLHPNPSDPLAWREFVTERLAPFLLALTPDLSRSGDLDRTYAYDPRTTTDPPRGLPAAGVLTSIGNMATFARERPRAARYLEMFGCQTFVPPPAELTFNAYNGDPATSGTCQHCHRLLDPAAIFFKRWDFGYSDSYIKWPFLPGIGPWKVTEPMLKGRWPYNSAPFNRWPTAFVPGTKLTPATESEVAANPGAVFLDTLPQSESLLGQKSDGTMGPLGFAKILVRSGAFDQCAVQHLHERFVGRMIDPATEVGYLHALTAAFVKGERRIRPFIHALVKSESFRRGF
jgi:hypothetical protein